MSTACENFHLLQECFSQWYEQEQNFFLEQYFSITHK